jgi:hypothetical protein
MGDSESNGDDPLLEFSLSLSPSPDTLHSRGLTPRAIGGLTPRVINGLTPQLIKYPILFQDGDANRTTNRMHADIRTLGHSVAADSRCPNDSRLLTRCRSVVHC